MFNKVTLALNYHHNPKHVLSPILNTLTHQLTYFSSSPLPPNPTNFKLNGHLNQALLEMAIQGIEMKFQDYFSLLNECINQRAIREGQRVHSHMIKTHYHPPMHLSTRLIVLYTKCDCLRDARNVLAEMPERNVVAWTALMSGYSRGGHASEALNLFLDMLRSGTFCDDESRTRYI